MSRIAGITIIPYPYSTDPAALSFFGGFGFDFGVVIFSLLSGFVPLAGRVMFGLFVDALGPGVPIEEINRQRSISVC